MGTRRDRARQTSLPPPLRHPLRRPRRDRRRGRRLVRRPGQPRRAPRRGRAGRAGRPSGSRARAARSRSPTTSRRAYRLPSGNQLAVALVGPPKVQDVPAPRDRREPDTSAGQAEEDDVDVVGNRQVDHVHPLRARRELLRSRRASRPEARAPAASARGARALALHLQVRRRRRLRGRLPASARRRAGRLVGVPAEAATSTTSCADRSRSTLLLGNPPHSARSTRSSSRPTSDRLTLPAHLRATSSSGRRRAARSSCSPRSLSARSAPCPPGGARPR